MQEILKTVNITDLEKLGRWLCFIFYRSPEELQHMEGVHFIFEKAAALDSSWAELLSGGFRIVKLNTVKRAKIRGCAGTKWSRLGEVVRPNQKSIDGVGFVRAREVLLYLFVAEEFVKLLSDAPDQ